MTDWFTADEIAALQGWSAGYVRNLASEFKWRRLGTRPQQYHIRDVMETLRTAKDRPT